MRVLALVIVHQHKSPAPLIPLRARWNQGAGRRWDHKASITRSPRRCLGTRLASAIVPNAWHAAVFGTRSRWCSRPVSDSRVGAISPANAVIGVDLTCTW